MTANFARCTGDDAANDAERNAPSQHDLNRLEAVIFASEAPISDAMLKQVLSVNISSQRLSDWLTILATRYQHGALELVHTTQGWRMQVRAEHAPLLAQLWPERPFKLSQALLETLSVIAYRQPVTRSDIEQLRGVAVNSQILRTLFDRQWIAERGFRDVAGRPALLVTTRHFLDAFGLPSLAALPPLGETAAALQPVATPAPIDAAAHTQQDFNEVST